MAKTKKPKNLREAFESFYQGSFQFCEGMLGCEDGVRPPCGYYHYSNPMSQNSLIRVTEGWIPRQKLPKTLGLSEAYIVRMQQWDAKLLKKALEHMPDSNFTDSAQKATDEQLIKMAKTYFKQNVIAVRIVYAYNVATGYPCERVAIIYEKKKGEE